jgi:hypothetical protein
MGVDEKNLRQSEHPIPPSDNLSALHILCIAQSFGNSEPICPGPVCLASS